MSVRRAAWLAAAAQALPMLLALRGGVGRAELVTAVVPGLAWIAYFVAVGRNAPIRLPAAVALCASLPLAVVSFDWITRAAVAGWVVFLGSVAAGMSPARVRTIAGVVTVLVALRCFAELYRAFAAAAAIWNGTFAFSFAVRPLDAIAGYIVRPAALLFFWLTQAVFFRAMSREPEASGSVWRLS